MKKKYFLIILFLIFAIFLVGCSDKKKIEKVVDNYWLVLSNQQYELAKTYCVKMDQNIDTSKNGSKRMQGL